MKPSREEVLRIARECGITITPGTCALWSAEELERFAAAIYEAGAAAERAVSDKLLEALREYDRLIGYQYSGSRPAMTALANAAQNGARAIAEVEAMRKES